MSHPSAKAVVFGFTILALASAVASGQGLPGRGARDFDSNSGGAPVVDAQTAELAIQALRRTSTPGANTGGVSAGSRAAGQACPNGSELWEEWSNKGGCDSTGCGGQWTTGMSGTQCGSGSCGSTCGTDWTQTSCTSLRGACGTSGGCIGNPCGGQLMGFEFFGEMLYLRPRNAEVPYAVPVDGPIAPVLGNGIQIGPTRVLDPDHRAGFRVGLNAVSTACGRITGQWAHFESRDTDAFAISTPNVIRSLVTHPLGNDVASDGLQTSGGLDIDFDLFDLALQTAVFRGTCWAADVIWGLRYGQLGQDFSSSIAVNGNTTVSTEVDFNGVGPRLGLISQRNLGFGSLYAFSRSEASFLLGSSDADYVQQDTFAGTVVTNSWEAGRVVPVLEFELGLGLSSPTGRFQLRSGYLVSAWFNTVTTSEFIHAVQRNDPRDLGEGISFDGWNLRCELRF